MSLSRREHAPVTLVSGLGLALALALALGACAHSRETTTREPEETYAVERPGRPPVTASPGVMLKPEGVRQLQRALADHGQRIQVNGRYDQQTRAAVLAFQQQQDLAQTSMPDLKTLTQLGLDAIGLYQDLDSEAASPESEQPQQAPGSE